MKAAVAVLSVVTLLVACRNSMCACPPAIYQARFTGSVIGSTGPITDARVFAKITRDCQVTDSTVDHPDSGDLVNAGGHYEFVLYMGSPGPSCARLIARWPGDSAVRDSIQFVAPTRNETVVVDFNVP